MSRREPSTSGMGVALAALALVLAAWSALHLSQSASHAAATASPSATPAGLPSALEGFRADVWYLPDDSMLGFVEVPPGSFVMGSDPSVDPLAFDIERWGDGQVQGTVHLDRFHMGRYEVTVAQYAAFVRASGHVPVDPRAWQAPLEHPATFVSWPDAVAYASWLDEALHASEAVPPPLRRLLGDGWRVTLPSEAQWEKAARGSDGRIYPWGDAPLRDRANFRSGSTMPVGSFPCSECAHGLSDMSGNVWEWTRSSYRPYPFLAGNDQARLDADALWVMRGGSFGDGEQLVRAANRGGADPGARRPFIGFRLALTRD